MGTGFGPGATGFVGLTVAFPAFGFAAFGLAFAADGFEAFGFEAAGFVAAGFAVVRADARRSPPMRDGRVERRLPITPVWAARLADFLAFFFADFWVTRSTAGCEFRELALRRGTVNERSGRRPL